MNTIEAQLSCPTKREPIAAADIIVNVDAEKTQRDNYKERLGTVTATSPVSGTILLELPAEATTSM